MFCTVLYNLLCCITSLGAYVTATKGLKCARGLGGLSPESIEDAADALNVEVRMQPFLCHDYLYVEIR